MRGSGEEAKESEGDDKEYAGGVEDERKEEKLYRIHFGDAHETYTQFVGEGRGDDNGTNDWQGPAKVAGFENVAQVPAVEVAVKYVFHFGR